MSILPRVVATMIGIVCVLSLGGCATGSANTFASDLIHDSIQQQFDEWDVSARERGYRRRGADPNAARRNAEYDFIRDNNRFP